MAQVARMTSSDAAMAAVYEVDVRVVIRWRIAQTRPWGVHDFEAWLAAQK